MTNTYSSLTRKGGSSRRFGVSWGAPIGVAIAETTTFDDKVVNSIVVLVGILQIKQKKRRTCHRRTCILGKEFLFCTYINPFLARTEMYGQADF